MQSGGKTSSLDGEGRQEPSRDVRKLLWGYLPADDVVMRADRRGAQDDTVRSDTGGDPAAIRTAKDAGFHNFDFMEIDPREAEAMARAESSATPTAA